MGFSYSVNGLCCDFCGADHTTRKYVKKIECPYGYCQAWATCDVCRAKKLHMQSSCTPDKKTHKEYCKPQSVEFNAKQKEKEKVLQSGKFIRTAALGFDDDRVKVIFENKDGIEKAAWMTSQNYRKIPLGVLATLEDFEILCIAKNTNLYDAELEAVA